MSEAVLVALALALMAPPTPVTAPLTPAQEAQIRSAESAGPASISSHATIRDWEGNVLREGRDDWVCLPDRADTPGTDPWCVNGPWLQFLEAYVNQTEPRYTQVGIAYMLAGDTPFSNTDPYATEPTGEDDWVTDLGAHLMMLVPDHQDFANLPTDHRNGGPWIMWPDTPYAHIMIPVESYGGSGH